MIFIFIVMIYFELIVVYNIFQLKLIISKKKIQKKKPQQQTNKSKRKRKS